MTIRLTETQRRIVEFGEGALLVVAGPGSGKTRVLTERVRRLLGQSKGHFRILALTFTNKAANEMKERLAEVSDIDQRAFIGTIHSFCMIVLAHRGTHVGLQQLPHIFESYTDRKHVLRNAISEDPELSSLLRAAGSPKEQNALLTRWLDAIHDQKTTLNLPESVTDETLRRVYELYDGGLRASNAVDFDDLLLLTYHLFLQRPKIADFYRRQYRYICIDESQDLNEAQYQLIRVLCGSSYRNVMMVGDPKQAIYVWNGADPRYLDMFETDFRAKKISLSENFRSSWAVVNAARRLDPTYEIEGSLPIQGDLRFFVGADENDEASQVMDYLAVLLEESHPDIEGPVVLDRCAILGRTRYVFHYLEEQLKEKGWQYYKQLSAQHESESGLLRDFELCMRVLANPLDRFHYGEFYSRWRIGGLGPNTDLNVATNPPDFLNHLLERASTPSQIAIKEAIHRMNISESDFDFWAGLESLRDFASSVDEKQERALILEDIGVWKEHWNVFLRTEPGRRHDIANFLSQVSLGATQQPRREGLALLTIHSAKGLEFDVVCLMGLAEGTLPDYRAKDAHSLAEEKRNAFVGITRSRRLLVLSYSETKCMPWGEIWQQKPSRYLSNIGLV